MRINTEFGSSGLVVFLMVLKIFNNESVNSIQEFGCNSAHRDFRRRKTLVW